MFADIWQHVASALTLLISSWLVHHSLDEVQPCLMHLCFQQSLTWGSACCAGANKRKLKKVYVLEPTGNPERPFEVKRYVNATQDNIFNALARSRLGILGLVPRSDLPDNFATVDFGDLDIPPLGDLDLEDGAEYVALCNWHPKVEQVATYFTHATIDTVGVHGACCLPTLQCV